MPMPAPNGSRDRPVLVIGGTGKTGRRVAERLTARGVPVRVGSRSGTPPFNWEDPSTWPASLDGASAAYITYQPDIAVPGAAEAIASLAAVALERNVRRLVLLSGRGEEGARRAEEALKASGADWTILSASWFCQNFSESFMLESVLAGELALPPREVREPFVDADDIADVAVEALLDPGHIGQLYELTGPRAITFAEAIQEIAEATGRPIRYVSIPADQFVTGLQDAGVPPEYVALLAELFTEVLDGRNSHLADGVQRALGRAPRDFRDYARAVAATGLWNHMN